MHEFGYGTDFVKYIQRDDTLHRAEETGDYLGPVFKSGSADDPTDISWTWGTGKLVVDVRKVTQYLEDDGYKRVNRPTTSPGVAV